MKEIPLETMGGYQFQKFVANLFKKLGFINIKVGPPTADRGIDISVEQRTEIGSIQYIVECKHHPDSSIGRPVVQKLHSAVMSTPVLNKGIIVTSGHFSSPAIKYAEEVGIELIDIEKLVELARKVGLSLKVKPSLSIENCFPISEKSKLISKLFSFLQSDLIGFDKDSTNIEGIGLKLLSSYMIDYSIGATFSTSVGIIHSIDEKSSLFLMGNSGRPINPIIIDPLLPRQQNILELNEEDLKGVKLLEKGEFVKDSKEIKEMAIKELRRLYTKNVSYYGANNVHYEKTCIPRRKDITIIDIKRVYIPIWNIAFSLSKYVYTVGATEGEHDLNILPSKLTKLYLPSKVEIYPEICMICAKGIKHVKFLCNDCGKIVCENDSFECKSCGKIICKEDTIFKRKFLLWKEKYCTECAKIKGILETR